MILGVVRTLEGRRVLGPGVVGVLGLPSIQLCGRAHERQPQLLALTVLTSPAPGPDQCAFVV